MSSLSCLFVFLSALYVANACDSTATGVFSNGAITLEAFASQSNTRLIFKSIASNGPAVTSAEIILGAFESNTMTGAVKMYKEGAETASYSVKFGLNTDGTISGVGYLGEPEGKYTYYIRTCGQCQVTYLCNDGGSSLFYSTYQEGKVCSDADQEQCASIVKQADASVTLEPLGVPPTP